MDIEQLAAGMRREIISGDCDRLIFNDFAKALPSLRSSGLYRIFRAMPKGRLMHAHIEASFDMRYMLSMALSSNDVYVFLNPETDEYRYCQLAHRAWFPGFAIPDGWVNLNDVIWTEGHYNCYNFPDENYNVQMAAADVNGNGQIDNGDRDIIYGHYYGGVMNGNYRYVLWYKIPEDDMN